MIAGTASASSSAPTPLAHAELVQMPKQAKAGDVGDRVSARLARLRTRRRALSSLITVIASASSPAGARPRFAAVVISPAPIGLVRKSRSPASPPALVMISSGVSSPGHRQAVLGLWVLDRVPPGEAASGCGDDLGAAAEDLGEDLGPKRVDAGRRPR